MQNIVVSSYVGKGSHLVATGRGRSFKAALGMLAATLAVLQNPRRIWRSYRVEAFRQTDEKTFYYDVMSSYPSAMLMPRPAKEG